MKEKTFTIDKTKYTVHGRFKEDATETIYDITKRLIANGSIKLSVIEESDGGDTNA